MISTCSISTSKSNQMISGDQETAGVGKDFGKNGENLRLSSFFLRSCVFVVVFTGPRCLWGPVYGSWCLSLPTTHFWKFADVTLADDDTNSILADDVNLELCHLDDGWAQCGVSKVGVQELHGMLEMVCWGGNGCHWDGGERVGWQGVAKGRKGGHQGVEEGL